MTREWFLGKGGVRLAAEAIGPDGGEPVLLLHGAGQTRGSWRNGAARLAAAGYRAISIDARGHGESEWAADRDYSLDALVADVRAVISALGTPPALVGASMGGTTSLALLGEPGAPVVRALALVDVTPRIDLAGAKRIGDFMGANPDGFATMEEAADAVSAYNPNRPRPKDVSGLRRNLREVGGRLFWHWDPAFLAEKRIEPLSFRARIEAAARVITVPTLLVRGARSDIVGDAEVAHFRAIMPRAEFVDVAGAGHMVAGDRNDAFNDAILAFLQRIDAEVAVDRRATARLD